MRVKACKKCWKDNCPYWVGNFWDGLEDTLWNYDKVPCWKTLNYADTKTVWITLDKIPEDCEYKMEIAVLNSC